PGPKNLAVDGNAASRVFHIAPSNTVSLAGLTIRNGFASECCVTPANAGGGILNEYATVTVSNATLSANSSAGYGGGIDNYALGGSATLLVVNSTLTGNSAAFGAGIDNFGELGSALLQVVNSTLSGNSAGFGNGGGILNLGASGSAEVQIRNSTLSGNF